VSDKPWQFQPGQPRRPAQALEAPGSAQPGHQGDPSLAGDCNNSPITVVNDNSDVEPDVATIAPAEPRKRFGLRTF